MTAINGREITLPFQVLKVRHSNLGSPRPLILKYYLRFLGLVC